MIKKLRVLWLLPLAIAPLAAAADIKGFGPAVPALVEKPIAKDLLNATVHRLDNGLTVYLSPNHQEPRVTAWIAVRAGGKYDPADSTGMAHYLEHMLFKGTESLGTLDYGKEKPHLDRILALYEELFETQDPAKRAEVYGEIDKENIAASAYAIPNELDKLYRQLGFSGVNAFTGNEQVVYVCSFPANRAEVWAKVEADRFANPVFRLFQTEIETVYEEKNMSLDHPEDIIEEALERRLFKFHPYGQQTILGSIEHLKNPSLKKMYDFYARYYIPNNMCVALAGDFDRKEMLAVVKRHMGAWKPRPLPKLEEWETPAPEGAERVEVKYEAEEKALVAWMLPGKRHPDASALRVMDMLMDNSVSGIINLSLNQAQKVKSSWSYAWLANDAGAYVMGAVPKKDQTLEEAEELLLGCVQKLHSGEFTDEDIRAIITDFEINEKRRLESNDARVSVMVGSFTSFMEWPETVEDLERLRKVSREDVLRVARRYIGDNRVVAFRRNAKPELPSIEKPDFTKLDIDPSLQSAYFAEVAKMPAKPLKPRWLKKGRDYNVRDFPWGRLYSGKNPVNDLFEVWFGFYYGIAQDRRLAEAMNLMNFAGAGDMTAEEFKKKLYGLGAALRFGSGERGTYVLLSGLDKNLEASLELMFELFRAPNLDEDALEKMVQVRIGAHQDNKKEPGYIHYALSQLAQRGADSLVLKELGDPELKALKTDELVGLASGVWQYERQVCYVGNRPGMEIARLVDEKREEYLPPPAQEEIRYLKPNSNRILFAHRDMIQSWVGIFAADEVFNPDRSEDYEYLANYLGGGMSALIFQEVREARALAYSAWGWYGTGNWKGDENLVYGRLTTQADKTIEATGLIRDLLREPPLSAERFAETRKAIEEGYRTKPVGFRRVPYTIIRWEEQGIGVKDPRPARFKKALKYRLDDLENFASRFKDKPFTVYILGNRERVDLEQLRTMGDFEEKTLEDIFPY